MPSMEKILANGGLTPMGLFVWCVGGTPGGHRVPTAGKPLADMDVVTRRNFQRGKVCDLELFECE